MSEEKKEFKVDDLVSTPFKDDKFIKGKVIAVEAANLVIETWKKDKEKVKIRIPKKDTIKMFPGQKIDSREIKSLFPIKGIDYLDISKKDRLQLLKGNETGAIKVKLITPGKNNINEIVESAIKLKIVKDSNFNLKLTEVKAFTIDQDIYNYKLNDKDIENLKKGNPIVAEGSTKKGIKFDMIIYPDLELNKVRVKSAKNEVLQKLDVYQKPLTKKELDSLNKGKTIIVSRKAKDGSTKKYEVKYNKAFGQKEGVSIKKADTPAKKETTSVKKSKGTKVK